MTVQHVVTLFVGRDHELHLDGNLCAEDVKAVHAQRLDGHEFFWATRKNGQWLILVEGQSAPMEIPKSGSAREALDTVLSSIADTI
jgi:hypothetical protein